MLFQKKTVAECPGHLYRMDDVERLAPKAKYQPANKHEGKAFPEASDGHDALANGHQQ